MCVGTGSRPKTVVALRDSCADLIKSRTLDLGSPEIEANVFFIALLSLGSMMIKGSHLLRGLHY